MKRILSILRIVLVVISLAGFASASPNGTKDVATIVVAQEEEEPTPAPDETDENEEPDEDEDETEETEEPAN